MVAGSNSAWCDSYTEMDVFDIIVRGLVAEFLQIKEGKSGP